MPRSYQINDFSGGFTSNPLNTRPDMHGKIDNMLIVSDRTLMQRPGSRLIHKNRLRGHGRINSVINFNRDEDLLVVRGRDILKFRGNEGSTEFPLFAPNPAQKKIPYLPDPYINRRITERKFTQFIEGDPNTQSIKLAHLTKTSGNGIYLENLKYSTEMDGVAEFTHAYLIKISAIQDGAIIDQVIGANSAVRFRLEIKNDSGAYYLQLHHNVKDESTIPTNNVIRTARTLLPNHWYYIGYSADLVKKKAKVLLSGVVDAEGDLPTDAPSVFAASSAVAGALSGIGHFNSDVEPFDMYVDNIVTMSKAVDTLENLYQYSVAFDLSNSVDVNSFYDFEEEIASFDVSTTTFKNSLNEMETIKFTGNVAMQEDASISSDVNPIISGIQNRLSMNFKKSQAGYPCYLKFDQLSDSLSGLSGATLVFNMNIKALGDTNYRKIIHIAGGQGQEKLSLSVKKSSSDNLLFKVVCYPNEAGDDPLMIETTTSSLSLNKWYQYGISIDLLSNIMSLYSQGLSIGSSNVLEEIDAVFRSDNVGSSGIGCFDPGDGNFEVSVDEVQLYRVGHSAATMDYIFNGGAPIDPRSNREVQSSLVHFFRMGDEFSPDAKDLGHGDKIIDVKTLGNAVMIIGLGNECSTKEEVQYEFLNTPPLVKDSSADFLDETGDQSLIVPGG